MTTMSKVIIISFLFVVLLPMVTVSATATADGCGNNGGLVKMNTMFLRDNGRPSHDLHDHHRIHVNKKMLKNPVLFIRGGGGFGGGWWGRQKEEREANRDKSRPLVALFNQDGKKSAVTGIPMFQPWVYPPIELGFVIAFWVFTLQFFSKEAKTFWTYISISHMALIAITDYHLDTKEEKRLRLWNIPIVPVQYMWYYDILLTVCSVVHPILYPDCYGPMFWAMVVGVPIAAPLVLFSVDTNPEDN